MTCCSDKRFEDMLYAYELGMLSDDDRRELELHLLECEYCFDKARRFQRAARLLRNSPRVRESIRVMADQEPSPTGAKPRGSVRSSGLRRLRFSLLPTSLAAVLVLLILLLKDWQFEIQPSLEAVAVENRVVVMYFDNLAESENEASIGEIVANLLITDLSQSQHLQLVSSQRLYDILRLLGKEGTKSVDKTTATRIAREARAKWLIMGSILQIEPQFILTIQLIDAGSGDAVSSRRIIGDPGDEMFALVDELTVEVKKALSLPEVVWEETDKSIADVTTHSPEAYRYYIEGTEYRNKFYWAEAIESFERALRYDSTFAMVYYHLATLKDRTLIKKAVKYSSKASPLERHLIASVEASLAGDIDRGISELKAALERYPDEKEALFRLGVFYSRQANNEEAIKWLTRAIEVDPMLKGAYNQLAYVYSDKGDFDQAVWAIDKYISLVPDEANPYDSKGDICSRIGKLDEALAAYKRAVEIKPDFAHPWMSLGFMYIFKQNYVLADSSLRVLVTATTKTLRSSARLYLAYVPLYQGKLDQALQILDDGLVADRIEQAERGQVWKHLLRAKILKRKGNLAQALQASEDVIESHHRVYPEDKVTFRCMYAWLLADNEDFSKAEQVLEDLKVQLQKNNREPFYYYYARGLVESSNEDWEAAVTSFEAANLDDSSFVGHFMLGRAYLELGRFDDAIKELEGLHRAYTSVRVFSGIESVEAHYYLGLAYEARGDTRSAIREYEKFLDIWQNADEYLLETDDARERLTFLKHQS